MKNRVKEKFLWRVAACWVLASVMILAPALAVGGTQARIEIEQAKLMYMEGNFRQALTLLDQAVEEEPENGVAYYYAGLCQTGLGNPKAAVPLLEKAISLLPEDIGMYEDLALAAVAAGEYEKADHSIDKVLAQNPDRESAILIKGQALMGMKRFEEALPWFKKIENSPEYGQTALYYQGVCLAHLGRTDESADYFERANQAGPDTDMGRTAGKYATALKADLKAPAEEEKPWGARIRLLYQRDTNIVPVNDSDYLPEDVSHVDDYRMVADLDLSYRFYSSNNTGASIQYMGYGSWHDREKDLDLMFHMGRLSGYYLMNFGGRDMMAKAALEYSSASLDNDPYSERLRISPEFVIKWNTMLRTRLIARYEDETFDDPGGGLNDRDNSKIQLSLFQHFLFDEGKINTWLGFRYGTVQAKGDNYDREDATYYAGALAPLPYELLLSVSYSYQDRRYSDNIFDRHEKRNSYQASLQRPVFKWLSLYAGAVYTDVDANFELLVYDRWIYSTGVVAEF